MPAALIQSFKRAGFGRGALGQREHRGALGHVEMHGHQPGARLDRRDVAAVDPVAVGEERLGERLAQIAGRAGDHRGDHGSGVRSRSGGIR